MFGPERRQASAAIMMQWSVAEVVELRPAGTKALALHAFCNCAALICHGMSRPEAEWAPVDVTGHLGTEQGHFAPSCSSCKAGM